MGNMGDAGEGAYTILKVTILACRGMYRSWRASRTGKVDPRGTFTRTPPPCPTPLKPPPLSGPTFPLPHLLFPVKYMRAFVEQKQPTCVTQALACMYCESEVALMT